MFSPLYLEANNVTTFPTTYKSNFSIGSCITWTAKLHGSLPAYDTIKQIMRICGSACNQTFHALLQIKGK